jgi:hypothetical protein
VSLETKLELLAIAGALAALFIVWLLWFAALPRLRIWSEKRAMRIRDARSRWDLIKPYEPSARERRL